MQLHKLLVTLAAGFSVTMSAPLHIEDVESHLLPSKTEATIDPAPRCGYVRLHEGDGYIVGVYSHATCEPIWKDQEATLFRIDTAGCSCKFFSSQESCENADPVQSFTGPARAESRFTDEKPTYVLCEEDAA